MLQAELSYKAFGMLQNQWKVSMFSDFFKGVTKARQELNALLSLEFSPDT